MAQQAEALLSELTDLLGAMTASQGVLVARLQQIRVEGIAYAPSAAGFVPPVKPVRNPTIIASDAIDTRLRRTSSLPVAAEFVPVIDPMTAPTIVTPVVAQAGQALPVPVVPQPPVVWPTPPVNDPPMPLAGARDYDYFADLDARLARLAESKFGNNESN